nr:transcription initiation factor IIF subunit alpha-like [Aegilops tauschii subsp. strangulata]
MGKDKTAALEHAKKVTTTTKGKKMARGTSSRSDLSPGWIQGDWIRSTIERDDLEKLVKDGLIADKSWRLPEGESEPQPREDERVLLATHIYTKMYSMPNGEQFQEGEESTDESGDWQSSGDDDDDSDDSECSEMADSPPCSERRTKQPQDPSGGRGKAAPPSAQGQKRTRTSSPGPSKETAKQPKVAPTKPRKAFPKIKAATSGTSMDLYKDGDDEETEDAATSKADPLADSTIPPAPLFVTHHVPEDQVSAAKEAIRQAGLKMEQMKVVREASQAAYDASSTLQTNVQKSCELGAQFAKLERKQIQLNLDLELAKQNLQKAKDEAAAMGDKMKQALEQKDLNLAAAQKTTRERTELADKKLASVGKLEEENAKLKTAINEANKEVVQLKKDKVALTDKVGDLAWKRDELEVYLGGLIKKMFLMLEEFCQNFEEETERFETNLDPINSPVKDEAAMNMLRLESHLASVTDYLARLKVAVTRSSGHV